MQKVNVVGMLDIKGTEQIRRVYSVDGLAPTLSTMQGGNRQPKILEPYCINLYKEDGTETSFQDRVYDTEQISPAITTSFRPSYIVAMRGRNPEHPTDRTPGLHTEQRLEPNMDGLCNTITTVQKDNLVMVSRQDSIKYKMLENGNIRAYRDDDRKSGVSEMQIQNPNNVGNTLTAAHVPIVLIKTANKKGYDEAVEGGDVCPTLTAQNNEICRIEKVGQISNDGSQCGTVVSDKGLCPTITAGTHGYANSHIYTKYRIRKLTPKECWRLMGFSDKDFDAAQKVNSNTQLYKQAGNSIVVNVLEGIFKELCF